MLEGLGLTIGAGLFDWIFNQIINDLYLDLKNKIEFTTKLNKCVEDWTDTLPDGHEVTASAIFIMDIEASNAAEFPRLCSLKGKISVYIVPTENDWRAAFMEIWEYRKSMAQDLEDLSGFFLLNRSEAADHLSNLSRKIHLFYIQHSEFFRPSTFNILNEILQKLRLADPAGVARLNTLAKDIRTKINSFSYIDEFIIDNLEREIQRISRVRELDLLVNYCSIIRNNIHIYNKIPKTPGKVKEHRDFIKDSHLTEDLEAILTIAEEPNNA